MTIHEMIQKIAELKIAEKMATTEESWARVWAERFSLENQLYKLLDEQSCKPYLE